MNPTKPLLLMLAAVAANASMIQYTDSVITSGTLDGTPFTNQLVTLTFVGNTANIGNPSSGIYSILTGGPATVTVAGVGKDVFTDQMYVADVQSVPGAGIGDVTTGASLFFATNAAFTSYNLNGAIGPLSGTSGGGTPSTSATVGGSLTLNGPYNIDHPATFTAVVLPEPATFLLFAGAFPALLFVRRLKV